jgi:hypothetical protein
MCCFTGPVLSVRKTRIFGRRLQGDRQCVVYETEFAAAADLAMVLPIPVRAGSGDDAVRFIDLSQLPAFFSRLDNAIAPADRRPGISLGGASTPYREPPLVVHQVGLFEASFVPTQRDFGRLDPRFRLSQGVLDALGERQGYGFVVVKLARTSDVTRVHPVGFTFPTREPERVFFPTVHVHDGEVHPSADFDHALYTTDGARAAAFGDFGVEDGASIPHHTAAMHAMKQARERKWLSGELSYALTDGGENALVDRGQRVYRVDVAGQRENEDTWVEAKAPPDDAEITAALEREAAAGGGLAGVKQALYRVRNGRWSFFQSLRNTFGRVPDVEICAIRRAERGDGSVFWVHARRANLRGRSDVNGARSVLCALAPPGGRADLAWSQAIVPLDSRKAVSDWLASGAKLPEDDAAWLRKNAC